MSTNKLSLEQALVIISRNCAALANDDHPDVVEARKMASALERRGVARAKLAAIKIWSRKKFGQCSR